MKLSGCDVPDWMLSIKPVSKINNYLFNYFIVKMNDDDDSDDVF